MQLERETITCVMEGDTFSHRKTQPSRLPDSHSPPVEVKGTNGG